MEGRFKKIIVADDHEVSVMLLSVLLRRLGFDVISAENGKQVMDIMKTVTPDLVFLDGKMPLMDGMTTLKAIKDDDKLSHVPVIMVTAHYDEQSHENYKKNGCFGYITKPINVLKLNKLIQEAIVFPRNNQRKNLRFQFNRKIRLGFEGQSKDYIAVILSVGGIYLRTPDPLPVGTEVSVNLSLDDTLLTLKGNVIYHKKIVGDIVNIDPGMAIEFKDLTERDSEMLKTYIAENLAWDLIDEQDEDSATLSI